MLKFFKKTAKMFLKNHSRASSVCKWMHMVTNRNHVWHGGRSVLRHREPVLVAAMHHPVMEAKCPAQLESAVDLSEPVIDVEDRDEPAGSVRGERANFTRLVLGCIEVKFCN